MSRRARFSQALATGVLSIGANIAFTLISVPLAFAYLSNTEFALWAIIAQLAGFFALIENSIAGSISRILIEHRDNEQEYANTVKVGWVACAAQGAIVALAGIALAPWISGWLQVADYATEFRNLYVLQCLFLGIGCTFKMFTHLLVANQQQGIINHAQTVSLLAMLLVQWLSFRCGAGIYGLAWGAAAGAAANIAMTGAACFSFGVLPKRPGVFSRAHFRVISHFSAELLLQVIGWQLIGSSQIIIVKLALGLEAAAIYAVCTKAFVLAQVVAFRVFDYSVPALSDMASRGESQRLRERFIQVITMSGTLAGAASIFLAACNGPFVAWWTSGRIAWAPVNDWLLGAVLFGYTVNRVHGGLAWVLKDPSQVRVIFPLEGLFVISIGWLAASWYGIPGLLLICFFASFAFSGGLGIRASAKIGGIPAQRMLKSLIRPAAVLALLGAFALVWVQLWDSFRPLYRLFLISAGLVPVGAFLVWKVGLPAGVRAEIAGGVLRTRA